MKYIFAIFWLWQLLLQIHLYAATVTWSDSGTDFEVGANWGGFVPVNDTSTDIATFSTNNPTNNPTLSIDRSVGGVLLSGGGYTFNTDGGTADTLTIGTSNFIDTNSSGTSNIISVNLAGTGSLSKSGSSNMSLKGANTYSGGTSITGGILFVNNNSALGSGNVVFNTGASFEGLGFLIDGVNLSNDFEIQNDMEFRSQSGTLSGTVTMSEASSTVIESTQSGGDSLTFSGAIVDGGSHSGVPSLWRTTSDGSITFSGAGNNTHSGNFQLQEGNFYANKDSSTAVNINSGNVQIATNRGNVSLTLQASNQLSDSKNLIFGSLGGSQGTLNLNGSYSEEVNTLNINSNSVLNYGTTGTANYFLFNNEDTTPNGILTIKNFENNIDVFAINNGNAINSSFLDSIQFEGFISGAVAGATGVTVGSYGGTWDLITPSVVDAIWDGSTDGDFNTSTNWEADTNPASGSTTHVKFSGGLNTTVDLDTNYTLAIIEISSDATAGFTLSSANSSSYTLNNTNTGLSAKIVQGDDNSHTISTNLILADDFTMQGSGTGPMTLSGVISGSATNVVKKGNSTYILSETNSATITTTTIQEGELRINGDYISDITVAGGTLSGVGTIKLSGATGDLALNSGIISPGTGIDSIGTLTFEGTGVSTFSDGSSYVWELADATNGGNDASAGIDWDFLSFSGTVDFGSLNANGLTIQIENVGSAGINFGESPGAPNSYKILEANSILNFNESYFNLDSSNWTDGGNWWYNWSISQNGNALYLSYDAVPEPSTYLIIGGVFLVLLYRFKLCKLRKK